MLPYFTYTEDIESFCMLMGFTIDTRVPFSKYVCMCSLGYSPIPRITSYNLNPDNDSLIPPEKVIHYLTLILNGYSYKKAVNELNVVG
jgi:hypothetical protein